MDLPSSIPPTPEPLWTLAELQGQAEAVLAASGIAPGSGRVRDVPDERTLRYYTTLGLLAPPAVMRGRKAFYSRAHLAQVVAIKRLQALGMSLAQVQRELAGATRAELEGVAVLPEELPARAFWAEEPAPAPAAVPGGAWLQVAPGVVLLLSGTAPDPAALVRAAAPLAAELRRQGLSIEFPGGSLD